MVGVRLQGRLGNQLFQYAFIIAVSKKLDTRFYIDQFIYKSGIDKYFEISHGIAFTVLGKLFSIGGYKNIFNFHLRRVYYKYLAKLLNLSITEYSFDTAVGQIAIDNNTIYQGYFQSESFFAPFGESIRQQFILKRKFIDQFELKYGELYQNNNVVTVHIRRTDYKNLKHLNLGGDDLSLPLGYYKKAISKYDGQNVEFVFITDDVNFVNENFKEVSKMRISSDAEIMDFQHLLNADGCIISNSTFSWWGAWLNNKPGKVIYAPQYFMGWRLKKEMPPQIYPASWIQIDC